MKLTEVKRSEHTTVADLLYLCASKFPKKEAVVFYDERYSYEFLDRESNRVANYIIASGMRKGERIGIMMSNSVNFLLAYFGIVKAGCVVVPINNRFRYSELEYILLNCKASGILVSEEFADVAEELSGKHPNIKTICIASETIGTGDGNKFLDGVSCEQPDIEINENDNVCIIYTSGTTGNPKGATFTHRKIVFDASIVGALSHGYNYESRALIIMPMTHSAPMNNHVLGTIYVGGTLVIRKQFIPNEFLQTIQDESITHFFGPVMVYLACINMCDIEQYDLSSVKMFIVGGSPIAEISLQAILKKFKADGRLLQVYGLTEGGPSGSGLYPGDMYTKGSSIGIGGCAGAEMKLVDDDLNVIEEPGVVGQIAVYSEANMTSYFDDEKSSAETIINGWILTGDLGEYDEDGYVHFVDRKKDIIISGGQNVYSMEVENAILDNPKVLETAVYGIYNPVWGETVKAIVVPKKGTELTPDEIREYCKGKIADFKCPRFVHIAEELPHNANGKILKNVIREKYGQSEDYPGKSK